MTPTKPAPTTRRRGGGIQLDRDNLRFASGEVEPEKEPAQPAKRTRKRAAPKTAADVAKAPAPAAAPAPPASTNRAAPAPPAVDPNPDAYEGELYPGEDRIKFGTTLPVHLKGQVDGAVRYAQDTGAIAGIDTITDFVRVACYRLVVELQQQHMKGQEFAQPRINRRGRAPSR